MVIPAGFEVRNLNRRDCPLGSSLVSVEKEIDEISATGGHQCLSRSLNRRPDTLERCLGSFRANKLESLPLRGQPTGLTLLSFAPAAVCPNPQNIANRKALPQGEGFPVGDPGGIRTHGLSLRRRKQGFPPIPLECPQTLAITAFLTNSIVPVSSKKHLFYPSAIRQRLDKLIGGGRTFSHSVRQN